MAARVKANSAGDAARTKAAAASASGTTAFGVGRSLPWIAVLILTAIFHFYRGVPVDALMFLAAAAALSIDLAAARARGRRTHRAAHRSGRASPRRRPWAATGLAAAALALVWAVLVLEPLDGAGIPAVVGLVGTALLLVVWPDRPGPPDSEAAPAPAPLAPAAAPAPARVRRAAYWWAGVVLFLCAWELGTYFIDRLAPVRASTFPPLTDLLQPLFSAESSRWLMTGAWLVTCGALVRVVRRP
ncbi:hypothetical protein [Specibacter sp. RAF43]|uniref:hypothetical protein n=1 Tax=Specibacter sp. RAF43 TaxID=3233057 RepID=UPI003F9A96C5